MGFLKAQATSPFRCSPAHRAAQISFSRKVPAFMALINSHATVAPGTMAAGSDRSKGCGLQPPALFLPTADSLHQWLHDPRYGRFLAMILDFAPPRALLADEIRLYSHIHGCSGRLRSTAPSCAGCAERRHHSETNAGHRNERNAR